MQALPDVQTQKSNQCGLDPVREITTRTKSKGFNQNKKTEIHLGHEDCACVLLVQRASTGGGVQLVGYIHYDRSV